MTLKYDLTPITPIEGDATKEGGRQKEIQKSRHTF